MSTTTDNSINKRKTLNHERIKLIDKQIKLIDNRIKYIDTVTSNTSFLLNWAKYTGIGIVSGITLIVIIMLLLK